MAVDPTLRREGDHMIVIDPIRALLARRSKFAKRDEAELDDEEE